MVKTISFSVPFVLVAACVFSFCNREAKQEGSSLTYLNLHDTVAYVGKETCRTCHAAIYDSYMKTGMGQSFHDAIRQNSSADFTAALVYDSVRDFYYKPFLKNDSLYVLEFRLLGKDTIHQRLEKISYIIGSGQHTNSHICSFNGYLFQAPVTFYTQKKKWDLAPGFEGGYNSRFSRVIEMECITCHNAYPALEPGSLNKYTDIKSGIDCERCHGAGAEHVRQKLAGVRVDTSENIDYSIVNPRKLSRDLQMSLCQRCHLQGVAVLGKGRDFNQFKPGMNLCDVWDVFLPETAESRTKFIMASQAERLRMSRCFERSQMTCITCHNPHISVKETPLEFFNGKCRNCHDGGGKICSEKMEVCKEKNYNCTGCHMPRSGSIDIPHVSITDHFIRKNAVAEKNDSSEIEKTKNYLRLKCYTRDHPPASAIAEAYLSFYEKFSNRTYLLDSAAAYIFSGKRSEMKEVAIHYYYLRENFDSIVAVSGWPVTDSLTDEWTFYRVGEAHYRLGNFVPAREYFSLAAEKQPLHPEFQNKLAAALMQLGKTEEAKSVYRKILSAQPAFEQAWCNLGYLLAREGETAVAEDCYDKALALNPDYEQAMLNKAALFMGSGRREQARALVLRVITLNPGNEKARGLLQNLATR